MALPARTPLNRIRWTPLAFEDLQRISVYIERQESLTTANRVCRIIYDQIQTLRRFPLMGKPGLEPGTRDLVIPSVPTYIVAYRTRADDSVEILRIWHAAQNRREAQY